MYAAVFFDIDNTLLLKKPSIPEKVYEVASRWDSGLIFEAVERAYAASELWQGEQIRKENETGIRMADEEYLAHVVEVYREHLHLELPACRELTEVFAQNYHKTYALAPGALKVLAWHKERNIPLGIVSNNHTGIREVLKEQGILEYFQTVIISEEVGVYKPDPEILRLACAQAGAAPENCLYVGDHPFDILCAHDAHMPVAWLPANRFIEAPEYIGQPEYTLHSLDELIKQLTM